MPDCSTLIPTSWTPIPPPQIPQPTYSLMMLLQHPHQWCIIPLFILTQAIIQRHNPEALTLTPSRTPSLQTILVFSVFPWSNHIPTDVARNGRRNIDTDAGGLSRIDHCNVMLLSGDAGVDGVEVDLVWHDQVGPLRRLEGGGVRRRMNQLFQLLFYTDGRKPIAGKNE